ncbi:MULTISPECIES: hypothetical protein [Rhodopseudomonas]|uniref:hypothetical protein n=1 Tax=Rhodopseudomonas TaxID=1073 RepID=UPI000AD02A45|nr:MULTISPECIES: hypothetical protein [Rhodopseudomonas]MDF3812919.1 hypothetical protein [Rhodopseudomonas sp. BAL398]WOK18502.1 hypothetical protein RBJ75_02945 [Rhodopseudomonas sp. BAL398]
MIDATLRKLQAIDDGASAVRRTCARCAGADYRMMARRWLLVILGSILLTAGAIADGSAACPDRPPRKGCGCKGGPGYRAPDGHCVGFRELNKVCGQPPTACVFENAPGAGANRECALKRRSKPAAK